MWSNDPWANSQHIPWNTSRAWSGVVTAGFSSQANTQLSIVAGRAFVNLLGFDFSSYLGRQLTIFDSGRVRKLVGFIKAVGTGETLATTGGPLNNGELITDPGFDAAGSWTVGTNWAVAGSNATATAVGAGTLSQVIGNQNAKLLKSVLICTANSAGKYHIFFSNADLTPFLSGAATQTQYVTIPNTNQTTGLDRQAASGNLSATFSSISVKQVLTPAVTGATIVTASGGSTFNWLSETASFNRNDSAGYYYLIN